MTSHSKSSWRNLLMTFYYRNYNSALELNIALESLMQQVAIY